MTPTVVDLSHFDGPGTDYAKLKASGIVGVIYKASQGSSMVDQTYSAERAKAKAAGLLWGAYHFGDNSDVDKQVQNFINSATLYPEDLFCIDYEDNGNSTMKPWQMEEFVWEVEDALQRHRRCVIYGGNLIKENHPPAICGYRRLWLAQYATQYSTPSPWVTPWLWQYTDGTSGPTPHTVDGATGDVDLNTGNVANDWA